MTTLAFKATYSDWKLIKTRGVVQVVMEVPLSEADAAYQILGGMPDSSKERWFGVAPLKPTPAEKENSKSPAEPQPAEPDRHSAGAKRIDWRELQPAAQAGIRCADVLFWTFLTETRPYRITNTLEASQAVREICGVKSRTELSTNHLSRVLWHQLDEHFQAWKLKERVGA